MNLGILIIVGSIITFTITLIFTIKIISLKDQITNIKSELYELKKKIKEHKE